MRHRLLLPCMALALAAQAQLGDRLRTLVEMDVHAPPDHDTAYVAEYRSNLLVSVVSKMQLMDVALERTDGPDLTYSINTREQYGIGIDYKWLSAEALFTIPAWSDFDGSLGESTSKGLGLGITRNRLWARGLWNTTQGYYMEDPRRWTGSEHPHVRPDIGNRVFLVTADYALSNKRCYSQRAAAFQTERQKRSAGSWLAGAKGWHTTVTGDSSLLGPALLDTFRLASAFTGVQRLMLGATAGYVHTFVFGGKGFLNLALQAGYAYAEQWIDTPAGRLHGSGLAPLAEFKGGLGFNGDRWYAALTVSSYYADAPIAEHLDLSLNHTNVRLAAGLRLGDPGIKALRKVGL